MAREDDDAASPERCDRRYGRPILSAVGRPDLAGRRHGGVAANFAPLMPQQVAADIVDPAASSGATAEAQWRLKLADESKTRGVRADLHALARRGQTALAMDLATRSPIALPAYREEQMSYSGEP